MVNVLFQASVLVYLLATGSFVVHLVWVKDSLARVSPLVLLLGFLVHTVALLSYLWEPDGGAAAQFRGTLSFYSWLLVGIYLLVQLKYRLAVLGALIAPLAFLMSLAAFTLDSGVGELPPALKTYWLPVHVTSALLGNAVFALAFGVSVVYLLQEHQLKKKKKAILHKHFPSLEGLDRLNYVFLVWGFPLMTLGIITGSLWARAHWGNYWSWDPRQISSALTWILYGVLLHGRITAGWRGKKAALWTIVGFAVVLSYFLWGDAVFQTRHGGRFD